jgi:hypothetical protein
MGRNTNLLLIGAGVAAVYLLYKKVGAAAQAAGAAYTDTVNKTSDVLSWLFGPAVTLPNVFYTVVFEDGSSHAVPANTVDANGNFTWTGYPAGSQQPQQLQLLVSNDGTKYAISG